MKRRATPGSEYAWRDTLFSLMAAFLALAVIALAALTAAQTQATQPPGRLVVSLHWQAGTDIDVDLWVRSPGDESPVGYSHRTDKVFDLLHDDRGRAIECAGQPAECDDGRTETAVARFLPEGLWTLNAVAYQSYDHVFPVHVWVEVDRIDSETHATAHLFRREGALTHDRQEITLLDFRLDASGNVIPGSDNDLLHPLWSGP